MALDRTGEPMEPHECPYDCRDGWLSPPDADVMRACPQHRPPRQGNGIDYDPARLSDRARAAIARADWEDRP
ncbi:hypothetical protein [Nocardia sp. NPDC050793]|uniref:hypothetical protein n=1 Tax=Nocardia sp. NPDC050793 TaxID=3155159 RepID=UPI0033CF3879